MGLSNQWLERLPKVVMVRLGLEGWGEKGKLAVVGNCLGKGGRVLEVMDYYLLSQFIS